MGLQPYYPAYMRHHYLPTTTPHTELDYTSHHHHVSDNLLVTATLPDENFELDYILYPRIISFENLHHR